MPIPSPTSPSSAELKAAIISALESDSNFSSDIATDAPALDGLITIISEQVQMHLNTIFGHPLAIPVPMDGGAFLQTTWKTATSI